MATAAEIRAELEGVRASVVQANQQAEQVSQEVNEALERQRLRREVDDVRNTLSKSNAFIETLSSYRRAVDEDRAGSPGQVSPLPPMHHPLGQHSGTSSMMDCKQAVSTGTFEWQIAGMTWLSDAIGQASEIYAEADDLLTVGPVSLVLFYCPDSTTRLGQRDDAPVYATLAARVVNVEDDIDDITAIRYRFYIKRADEEYIQWGQEGHVRMSNGDLTDFIVGPDVTQSDRGASGIFGLQHADLLHSDWLDDDKLTVKIEVQVRPFTGNYGKPAQPKIKVPAANMSANFLSLLEEERCADITFQVKGALIKAHSQVLAARSEVFERQFFGGLQESVTKEVVMDDIEPKIFKCFLKFLYTDDLELMQAMIKTCLDGNQSSGSTASTGSVPGTMASLLQDVLAISHKYQVRRLLSWCEQQLCEHITQEDVCSVLCQAHLCEAQQLESACLCYIKGHMSKISSSKAFARLTTEWPELMLKISLHAAGVSSEDTTAALSVQRDVRKRKRETS